MKIDEETENLRLKMDEENEKEEEMTRFLKNFCIKNKPQVIQEGVKSQRIKFDTDLTLDFSEKDFLTTLFYKIMEATEYKKI